MEDNSNPREGKLDSKYYTPTIDELVLGLQLDYKDPTGKLRVKYLDREDIESLGWEARTKEYVHYTKGIYDLFHYSKENVIKIYAQKELMVLILDKCKIKNKSELKKLLKQLGI